MLSFRLYDKKLDIDLDEWSNKDYSNYQNDVHKFALFNETISQIYNSYIVNPDQMGSVFDKVIVVEEDSLKVAVIVVNYFIDQNDYKKVLGINPILVNPKLINKGYGKRIIKYLIDIKKFSNKRPNSAKKLYKIFVVLLFHAINMIKQYNCQWSSRV